MVKIKVRSAEDIVRAYLLNMGYASQTDLREFIAANPQLQKKTSIIAGMDDIIYNAARRVLHTRLSKTRLVACYKAIFISCRIARRFGLAPLLPNFVNKEYSKIFSDEYFEVAPAYKTSVMPVQEIAPLHLHKES